MTHLPSSQGEITRQPLRRRLVMIVGGLSVVAVCAAVRYYWGPESASADSTPKFAASSRTSQPASPQASASSLPKHNIMAVVNNQQITRDELARECMLHYGEEVLESIMNKFLIEQECQQRGINVTGEQVQAEIERMARRFGLPKEQWLKMLKGERGINPKQYADDIIWPTLALRQLAGSRLSVTSDELKKAYETQYGPAVRARLIACKDIQKAKRLHAAAVQDPEKFGTLAKKHSEDAPSAAAKGVIQPIRMHGSYKGIEQAAFNMKDGEVSQVIHAGDQYVILKREGLLPGPKAVNFEQVAPQLEEIIRDGKLRRAADKIFQQLQETAKIQNVLNDPPARKTMPGVAAVINGHRITIDQLGNACLKRHGRQVLEGTINRELIEQDCKKRGIKVTEQELDQEIVRAASVSMPPKADGQADVEGWLKLVTEKQGVSMAVYRRDSVWPSLALKKLVDKKVLVTSQDLRKGFEANYGPRVRCRAIVMQNLRRANKVWEMARGNPTIEFFGELAEEYSSEPGSAALRGEVPPIQKHGGQPILEKEAFALQPGELSGVIQVGKMFVILMCESYTKPTEVRFEEVRDLIHEDIYEKKLRIAVGEYFQQLKDNASIDNFLAGTSHRPKKQKKLATPADIPTLRQVPGS